LEEEGADMAENVAKLPVKVDKAATTWRPFASLRREVDRLFEDFDQDFWGFQFRRSMIEAEPMWRQEMMWGAAPAVDIAESDKAFEFSAELPGMDEKSIEIKLANGGLTIKGEKAHEKEEKKKNYYLHERHFGSFERYFRLPEGIDTDRIDATFNKGVLTVTLPKTVEAQKAEKNIEVKAAA
jgi:HSP20 family protein